MEPVATVLISSSSTTVIEHSGSLGFRTTEDEDDSTALRARSRRTCDRRFVGESGVNPIVGATQQALRARVDTSILFARTILNSMRRYGPNNSIVSLVCATKQMWLEENAFSMVHSISTHVEIIIEVIFLVGLPCDFL